MVHTRLLTLYIPHILKLYGMEETKWLAFDHVAGILRPPFCVVVLRVLVLGLLQSVKKLGADEVEPSSLAGLIQQHQSVLNLEREEGGQGR